MLFSPHHIFQYIFDRVGPSRVAKMAAATLIGALITLIVLVEGTAARIGSTWSIVAVLCGGAVGLAASLLLTLKDLSKAKYSGSDHRKSVRFDALVVVGFFLSLILLIQFLRRVMR